MTRAKKRGVKPGTKRGPYKKVATDEFNLSATNINDILEARLTLRNVIKSRIKQLQSLLKRI